MSIPPSDDREGASVPGGEASATHVGSELPANPLSRPYLPITLSVLALVTIVAFENMAVSTAMPAVVHDLHAVRAYGFAFSVMLTTQLLGIVLAGVWTDRSGPLPGTFVGQILLAVGSAVCGFATRLDVFLLGRALTGLGGGLLVVLMYVIAGRVYPDEVRPKLFTYVSAAWILPSLLGAPLSAWLTETFSWRWVFWIVVIPVALTAAVMARAHGRVDTSALEVAVSSRDHRDHVRAAWGGVGIALSAGLLQLGIATEAAGGAAGPERAGASPARLGLAAAGVIGIAALLPVLLPRGTWRMARGIPSVILARALFTASFFGVISYIPLFLHGQRGASLQVAGLALALGSLGWAIGAWYQGHPTMTLPRPRLVTIGGGALALGTALLGVIAWLDIKAVLVVPALVIAGLGMGLGVTTTTVLALELSTLQEQAHAASQLQLADVLGSVLGIAAVTGVFAAGHVPGQDNPLYGGLFLGLGIVAVLVVPAGQRIRT